MIAGIAARRGARVCRLNLNHRRTSGDAIADAANGRVAWKQAAIPGFNQKEARVIKTLPSISTPLAGLFTAGLMLAPPPGQAAVDVSAAQALAEKNDCLKFHSADNEKKGPSLKKIAAKHKGKADAEEKLIKNMTTSSKVKLDDGTEEEHKPVNTKDPSAPKNLAGWILSH